MSEFINKLDETPDETDRPLNWSSNNTKPTFDFGNNKVTIGPNDEKYVEEKNILLPRIKTPIKHTKKNTIINDDDKYLSDINQLSDIIPIESFDKYKEELRSYLLTCIQIKTDFIILYEYINKSYENVNQINQTYENYKIPKYKYEIAIKEQSKFRNDYQQGINNRLNKLTEITQKILIIIADLTDKTKSSDRYDELQLNHLQDLIEIIDNYIAMLRFYSDIWKMTRMHSTQRKMRVVPPHINMRDLSNTSLKTQIRNIPNYLDKLYELYKKIEKDYNYLSIQELNTENYPDSLTVGGKKKTNKKKTNKKKTKKTNKKKTKTNKKRKST